MDDSLKSEIEAMLKGAVASLLPAIDSAAKAAVTAASPVAAVFVDPLIDNIDAYVCSLLGAPATVVTAPQDVESRLAAVEKHVAALTVASGAATSQGLATVKASVK